jgi:2-amino-4-hydroxy-6-hydroxymethyldihydropteridine diphosphokinase
MERVFLGLGSNIGDRPANIERACRLLSTVEGVRLVRISSLVETKPVGYEDQPDFINAVMEIETALAPRGLLTAIKEIERRMGRTPTVRFGPRIIDIDILLFGQRVIDEPNLTIPHPRMHERRFVLEPLAEIAPDVVNPVTGKRAVEILNELSDGRATVTP